jgi:hypothetical protein
MGKRAVHVASKARAAEDASLDCVLLYAEPFGASRSQNIQHRSSRIGCHATGRTRTLAVDTDSALVRRPWGLSSKTSKHSAACNRATTLMVLCAAKGAFASISQEKVKIKRLQFAPLRSLGLASLYFAVQQPDGGQRFLAYVLFFCDSDTGTTTTTTGDSTARRPGSEREKRGSSVTP